MATDLLGSSKHRRSSHAKDEFTSVTVRKEDPKEKAGIRLESEKTGRVKVTNIAKNGLFADTEIEIGDIVLSVNGKRLSRGEGPEKLMDAIAKAKEKVTVVVKKTKMKPRVAEKERKDTSDAQDNNVKKRDSYDLSKSQSNDKGNRYLENENKSKPKGSVLSTTISANKEDQPGDGELDETAGIQFVIQHKIMYVSHISKDSTFRATDLEVGDRVLSINDCNFREFADARYAAVLVKKAKNAVTLVVEKGAAGFTPVGPSTEEQKPTRTRRRSRSDSSRTSKSGTKKDKSSLKRMPKKSNHSAVSDIDSTDSLSEASFCDEDFEAVLPGKQDEYREVVIAAPKEFKTQGVGIEFDQVKNKYLTISNIKDDSIFVNTSLEVGDIVLEINDVNVRKKPDKNKAWKACMKTKETVTLLVWKAKEKVYAEKQFDLDASTTNLEWQ